MIIPASAYALSNAQWGEEDWADHFSSLVLNEMKKQRSPFYSDRNLGCAVVHDVGSKYMDESFDPGKDTHSAGALRLLFMSYDRQQLHPSCSDLLSYTQRAQRKLSCD